MYDPDKRFQVHFELTNKCQAACPNCARYQRGKPLPWMDTRDLSLQDVQKIMSNSSILSKCDVLYCGNYGDPAASKDLLSIVEWFKDQPFECEKTYTEDGHMKDSIPRHQYINTNGGLRDELFWKNLAKSLPKQRLHHGAVTFSIDGLEDTNHIYRRNVSWKQLWRNLNSYIDAGGKAIWEFLVFGHNKHQVEEAFYLSKKMGIEFRLKNPLGLNEKENTETMSYLHAFDRDHNYEYSITSANSDISGPVVLSRLNGKFEPSFHEGKVIASDREIKQSVMSNIDCKSLNTEKYTGKQDVYVRSDGRVLPCCFMDGTVEERGQDKFSFYQMRETILDAGNKLDVINNDLDEVIFGETFKKIFFDPMKSNSLENGKPMYCVETCGPVSDFDLIYEK